MTTCTQSVLSSCALLSTLSHPAECVFDTEFVLGKIEQLQILM